MTTREFITALNATLSEAPGEYISGRALDIEQVESVHGFDDCTGLGLFVHLKDGCHFQITVEQIDLPAHRG